jgi:hypothetical protein
VITLVAAIAITVILDGLLTWASQSDTQRNNWRSSVALLTALLISVAVIFYPAFVKKFPLNSYVTGNVPELYKFFAQQPANSLTASLSSEASNLPSFARRSILVGQEYGIPYHLGYYRQFRQRVSDLIQAQYSVDLAVVQRLIRGYKIDFWLLDTAAFEPEYLTKNSWLRQFQPAASAAVKNLQKARSSPSSQASPIVQQAISQCQVFSTGSIIVLQANCVANPATFAQPKI